MATDRGWMYKRCLSNGKVDPTFADGVKSFVQLALSNPSLVTVSNGENYISCPCKKCQNFYNHPATTVRLHLYKDGFCNNYEQWTQHGEPYSNVTIHSPSPATLNQNVDRMDEMLINAAGPDFRWDVRYEEEVPRGKAKDFFDMLTASEQPLWEIELGANRIKCEKYNVLSAVTKCLDLKSKHNMSQSCFDGMMSLIKDMLPENDKLPENFYQSKRMVKALGMAYETIDVCPKFCMLYYKQHINKIECDVCHESRYEQSVANMKGKPRARKVLRYLPITERLQRLYMTEATANHMRWHEEGHREKPNMMVHPADSEAWIKFDELNGDFAKEVRNVRLGLSTDGFMPYSSNAASYSCWPVFVFPYNLPPGLLMKEDTIFLALLLPGPTHPDRDIDVLLKPLIDELKSLWVDGIETYDVSRKQHFIMKASLLWTVSDFPAYEMLSGWGTHGRLGCPYCMGATKSFRLENGGKPTWFGCHRCFLEENHEFRQDVINFIKGKVDNDPRPPMLTGEQVLEELNKLDAITWGKTAKLDQIVGYGRIHHWQKKSIFFKLPYWSHNLLRHNIDMMHLEKNFAENLIYMLFDISNKTKDNAKAREDFKLYCNRPSLHLTVDKRKPKAPYALTLSEKRQVLKWLKEIVRFPDGYASNWSRCVNLTNCTLSGLKSHDFHVFMERLLPVAFRDFIPDEIWDLLCYISKFFREICAKELDPHRMEQLENEIVETICNLEKHFPPSFFDSMEHLVIHVAHEAKIGGPVGPRWMYACERMNKYTKMKVKNKARVEASIVEATLIQEISTYCSSYFAEQSNNGGCREKKNHSQKKLSIFETLGSSIGRKIRRTLDPSEYKAAHNYVLFNCPEIQPYIEEFNAFKIDSGQVTSINSLEKIRDNEFADWLRKRVIVDHDGNIDVNIRNLGLKPDKQAICYNGYEINGFKFHTETYNQNKSYVNNGVCIKGQSDDSDTQYDYYGVLQEVVELQYEGGNKVLLFKCYWFNITNGVRVDKQRGIVEVKHASRLRHYEPFVLALQAIQVYYLSYASTKGDRKNWWVAMKTQKKRKLGVGENPEVFQEEQTDDFNNQSINPVDLLSSMSTDEPQEMESDTNNDGFMINEFYIEQDDEDDDPYAHDM